MTSAFSCKTLLAFALLHFVLQGQICLLLQVFLDFLLLHSSPLWWKGQLLGVLVLEGLVGPTELFIFSFFSITGRGIDLDYRNIEWFALEVNWDHSVVFEIASKYCISDSSVNCDGYSISSKGFLPTVVDIMSSELNSPIQVHFSSLIPKMLTFTLAISCLTTSNLPWFMDLTSRFLCNTALYSIGPCFQYQSQPQLGVIFALALSLHSFWSYFSTDLQ